MKQNYKIILASNSPRRRELLGGLDLDFETRVIAGISEQYPAGLPVADVPQYIAVEKAQPYLSQLNADEIVLTADTIVVVGDEVLGKPKDAAAAKDMLRKISGRTHQVMTGVCLATSCRHRAFTVTTDVTFRELSEWEIDYYVEKYQPLDKAGAYGIQEWIGYVGVTQIRGSYFNVVGLPVQRIWEELQAHFLHRKE